MDPRIDLATQPETASVGMVNGLPAVWLANRNASIAAVFGVLALLAHEPGAGPAHAGSSTERGG